MADNGNYLDKAGALYLATKVKGLDNNKVDKVDGKGLSTNDYTTNEKTKLASVELGANKTVVATSVTAGDSKPVSGGAVNTFVAAAIADALKDFTGIDFEIVESLPTTGKKGIFYLIANGQSDNNGYDEYVWLSTLNRFEKVGSTTVDLSGYVKKTDLVPISNDEIDAMFTV